MFQQARSLKNLADPGVRRLLNRVQQLVAFDGHVKVWADGLSFANALSHPPVQLRNVERKPRRDRGWNPAIALRYREIRQQFARLCAAHRELGDLYISRLARICRHDRQVALRAVDLEQEPCSVPVRELAAWIESNILLELDAAPFDKQHETLVYRGGLMRELSEANRIQ